MEIAMYRHHHSLPFWHVPKNPERMFDVGIAARKVVAREGDVQLSEHWMWPILAGLHSLEFSALAHISFGERNGKFKVCHRTWVQFSDVPATFVGGLPVVVSDGKTTVECLWGRDNGTYTPYNLLTEGESVLLENLPQERRPGFWRDVFRRKLREAQAEAVQHVEMARKALEQFEYRAALFKKALGD